MDEGCGPADGRPRTRRSGRRLRGEPGVQSVTAVYLRVEAIRRELGALREKRREIESAQMEVEARQVELIRAREDAIRVAVETRVSNQTGKMTRYQLSEAAKRLDSAAAASRRQHSGSGGVGGACDTTNPHDPHDEAQRNRESQDALATRHHDTDVAIAAVENTLNAAVNEPVSARRDPTTWLPDEILCLVLHAVPFEMVWGPACSLVCRRWWHLVQSVPFQQRLRKQRWQAYASRSIRPRAKSRWDPLHDGQMESRGVSALTIGDDGTVYTAVFLSTKILAWSGVDGSHLQTFVGHTWCVRALTVGPDNCLYSGSWDASVRVWSCTDGALLQTVPVTEWVTALAVSSKGKIYAGLYNGNIRVLPSATILSSDAPVLLRHNNNSTVASVKLTDDGTVISTSYDRTIRLWSVADDTLITTIAVEGTCRSLACGPRGVVFAGCADHDIQVLSTVDGSLLGTLQGHTDDVVALVYHNRQLYSSALDGTLRVWSWDKTALVHTIRGIDSSYLACSPEGTLVSGSIDDETVMVW
eukprot:m.172871 g.172871  ORF g.172871 m.172871 type:complete len:529 (-) comp24299_c0_seq3:1146-2732(-)